MKINPIFQYIDSVWNQSVIPTLYEFIKIPNKSPAFDPNWKQQGHMDKAIQLLKNWCLGRPIKKLTADIYESDHRTPILFIEVEGQTHHTALLYGHLDKQPEMEGWREGLGPWIPVIENERLYGRGGGDDGYSVFSALTAIEALQQQNIPHPRCMILIEACEESGSYDLPHYMHLLNDKIKRSGLVIGLDSGAGNYEQLWCTTSIRGMVTGLLNIQTLSEGAHSGLAGGIVPSNFLIARQLLSRVENEKTGEVLLKELQVNIPENRQEEAAFTAHNLGDSIWKDFPFLEGVQPLSPQLETLLLNQSWRSTMTVLGISGLPDLTSGGNVLHPQLSLKLGFRLPPEVDPDEAAQSLKKTFETQPPFGAQVSFSCLSASRGWNAHPLSDWLKKAITEASLTYYQRPAAFLGTGGGIPFISMLGQQFPKAEFVVTGVLGPHSNAHGPNEFLDIPMAKKVSCCVADILKSYAIQAN